MADHYVRTWCLTIDIWIAYFFLASSVVMLGFGIYLEAPPCAIYINVSWTFSAAKVVLLHWALARESASSAERGSLLVLLLDLLVEHSDSSIAALQQIEDVLKRKSTSSTKSDVIRQLEDLRLRFGRFDNVVNKHRRGHRPKSTS